VVRQGQSAEALAPLFRRQLDQFLENGLKRHCDPVPGSAAAPAALIKLYALQSQNARRRLRDQGFKNRCGIDSENGYIGKYGRASSMTLRNEGRCAIRSK